MDRARRALKDKVARVDAPRDGEAQPSVMRPTVTLHFAQSLDGKIDDPAHETSLRLSNDEGLRAAHRARADNDAVLVGINTVLRDDPKLNVRLVQGTDPHRVVLDSRLRTPPDARLFTRNDTTRVFIVAGAAMRGSRQAATLEQRGATLLFSDGDRPDPARALQQLGEQGIRSLLVEGGRAVLTAFMAARAVDVVQTEICMRWVGDGGLSAFDHHQTGPFSLTDVTTSPLGDHVLVRARPAFATAELAEPPAHPSLLT